MLVLFSCTTKSKDKNNTNNSTETKVNNVAYPTNYVVRYGKDTVESKKILFVVIDPHADGNLAVSKFQKVIENYNVIVAGLTDVENNQTDFMQRISADIQGIKHNLNINPEYVFIGGFSGGARMALAYAQANTSIKGLLMCGAGASQNQLPTLPVAMVIGIKDFNFVEQYYSPYSQVVTNDNILTIVFDGKHEWPPQDDIYSAVSFLLAKNNLINEKFDANFYLNKSNEYLQKKQMFLAFKMLETAYKISANQDKQEIKHKLDDFLQNPDFKNYMANFEQILAEEYDRNQTYLKLLIPKNLDWWKAEISKIDKLSNSNDNLQAASYARTKAFLGIAMYSYCSKEIQNPQSQNIDKYLKIYELLEPDNQDLKKIKNIRLQQLNK